MGELWGIIQAHLDRYGVREAAFARRIDTTPQNLNSWKTSGLRRLPNKDLLAAVARETGTSYQTVLDAALLDTGYISSASEAGDAVPAQPEPAPPAPDQPSSAVHVPEPEDNTGAATRPAHGPSRSRAEGAGGTRRHGRR